MHTISFKGTYYISKNRLWEILCKNRGAEIWNNLPDNLKNKYLTILLNI